MTCRADHAPKWPDFEPNNLAAAKHGAYSERAVAPRATEIAEQLRETLPALPTLSAARYSAGVEALARVMAQIALVHEWLDAHGGPLDPKGRPWPAANFAERLEARASRLREELGLGGDLIGALEDAAARARIDELAEGKRMRDAAEQRQRRQIARPEQDEKIVRFEIDRISLAGYAVTSIGAARVEAALARMIERGEVGEDARSKIRWKQT